MKKDVMLIIYSSLSILILSSYASSPFLQRMEENAGITLQLQQISPKDGEGSTYTCFALPLEFHYAPSRYSSLRVRLNQGFQSFAGTGLYGLGDLSISGKYLYRKNVTILGGINLPTGRKELTVEQIGTTSAARIPFINSPLIYGNSGFGLHLGLSYGMELNERTGLAVGISYRLRTTYKPVKDSPDYKPSDEIMLAAGVNNGDKIKGFTADAQFSIYTAEKLGGKKFTEGGTGMAISFKGFLQDFHADALLYLRQASKLTYGGDFKPPLIMTLLVGNTNLIHIQSLVPYVGIEHTGEGTLIDSANLFLLGAYYEEININGYPMNPFIQFSYGSIGGNSSTLGFKVGTNISFQVY
jgi:hypothetical protein